MDDDFPPSTLGGLGRADRDVSVRVVHSAGLTRVKYAPKLLSDGETRLFTAGDDFLVRILPDHGDASNAEPLLIDDATKSMSWIDADQDYLVTASEDGCIRIYQYSIPAEQNGHMATTLPTDLVCILARCSLSARCAALERKVDEGKTPRVAVCSDELVVKVVDAGDPKRVQLITGHQRGVRAASWCPTQAIIATSSSDATVKLWDLSTTEPACIASIEGVIGASKSDSELSVEAVWHASGTSFALPSKTHEIAVITRERSTSGAKPQWRKTSSLSAPDDCSVPTPTGEITCMSFCPNGRYLAAATTDGRITIWEWSTQRPIRSKTSDALVTSIDWHPSEDVLSWADNAGQLSRWKSVVGATMPTPYEHIEYTSKEQVKAQRHRDEIDALFDGTGIDDDGEEDDDFVADADTDRNLDRRRVSREESVDISPVKFRPQRRGLESALARSRKQPTFQSTATPMRNARRYLAFNLIGSLVAIDQNTHQSISFEPHDAGSRRKWRFIDNHGYNMASIGANGALFACPEQEEKEGSTAFDNEEQASQGHSSTIYFKPFEMPGAWEMPGSEWSAALPKGEVALAIAMGGRRARERAHDTCTAVAATSKGYLRFFSGSGLQKYIWAFGSQIVTMSAGDRLLLVIHRNAPAVDGLQNLRYTVVDLMTLQVRQDGLLPLAPDVTLVWAGFNNMDAPAIFDSHGVLLILDRVLHGYGQARWTPVLDTKVISSQENGDGASSSIRYWPVGLDGSNLLAIMLKGQAFPDASSPSRPLIQEIALSIPVIDAQGAAGVLEEQYLRQNQLASLSRAFKLSLTTEDEEDEHYVDILDQNAAKPAVLEHEADKALLQLIQLACKSDKHQRVLDAARELHSSRTLDAAMQIGTFFHLSSLVDRMEGLREFVSERRERDEQLIAPSNAVAHAPAHPRILAASSPSPALYSEAAAAKRALGGDFTSTTRASHKAYGSGRRSELANAGHSPSNAWPSSSITSSAGRQTAESRPPRALPDGGDSEDESGNQRADQGSPRQTFRKRQSAEGVTDTLEGSPDDSRLSKRAREGPTSPFANKTNRSADGSASSFAAPAAPPTKKNPFARTAGMTRDRSMHKSNSFFERVDNVASTASAASGVRSASGRTKQATLFGMMPRSSSGTSASASPALATPASVPAFADSADEDSQGQDSESLRLTLTAAQRQAAESQRLEETQYPVDDEDEEETQHDAGDAINDMEESEETMDSARLHEHASTSISVV